MIITYDCQNIFIAQVIGVANDTKLFTKIEVLVSGKHALV
jgi:hypothetical protein